MHKLITQVSKNIVSDSLLRIDYLFLLLTTMLSVQHVSAQNTFIPGLYHKMGADTPSQQDAYCTPTWSGWAVNEPTEPITLVQLGQNGVNGIDNSSSDIVSSDTPRYENFSNVSMDVVKGESYTLMVKGNTDGDNTNYITVYFDWNGDNVFSNATPASIESQQQWTGQTEKHQHGMSLINSTGLDNVEVSYVLNIPTDAITGSVRMRVVKNYNAPSPAPCSNPFIFGQVEDYTLNIVEPSDVSVQSVTVTTQGDVAAEITETNGTLQLVATVNPTSADQNVTWSVSSGDEFASVDANGLVTGLSNGTANIRATSVSDPLIYSEIEVIINMEQIAEPCQAVDTLLETFNDFTAFPENCWSGSHSGYIFSLTGEEDKSVLIYSSENGSDDFYLVSPPVSTINGQYALKYDVKSAAEGVMIQVGTLSSQTDFSDFAPVGDAFVPVQGTTYTTDAIAATAGHQYVAIKFSPNGNHKTISIDNVEWKPFSLSSDEFYKTAVNIYPNPTSDFVNIETDADLKSVRIFNLSGQLVKTVQTKTLDLSDLSAGTYVIEITFINNVKTTRKLIKR